VVPANVFDLKVEGEKMECGRRKIGKILIFAVLFASLAFVSVDCASAATHYVNPGDSIQTAVDAASPGDTIIVRDGTYTENVNVNKRLTIQSENGADRTIVQAVNRNDHVFEITADRVTVTGFTAKGGRAGVYLNNVGECLISHNNLTENYMGGIYLMSSNNNLLSTNLASFGHYGIFLSSSSSNTLISNTLSENLNNFGVQGFTLSEFTQNVDTTNMVDGKPIYYWVNQEEREVPRDAGYVAIVGCKNIKINNLNLSRNNEGVLVAFSLSSTIERVKVSDTTWGIHLHGSQGNILRDNTLSNNHNGICLFSNSRNNLVTENDVSYNGAFGIWVSYSYQNKIYLNNFINNGLGNIDSEHSSNLWNSPEQLHYTYLSKTYINNLGNFWSDYIGSDADEDGIGDIAYRAMDNYPLMHPFETYILLPSPPPPNQPPNPPTTLQQFKADSVTTIPVGGTTDERTVYFKGTVSDPDGDQVKLQVELRNLDEYGGEFDETQGGLFESALVEDGSVAVVSRGDLIDADYHWRARAVDEHGVPGDWVEFGENDILDADFIVSTAPGYAIIVAGQDTWNLWPPKVKQKSAIDHSANNAYRTLRNLGFDDDHICYLNSNVPQDVDGDDEVDAPALGTHFENAINEAKNEVGDSSTPIILYLTGHGLRDPDCFIFDADETWDEGYLTVLNLRNMLSKFSSDTPMLIVLGSCYSVFHGIHMMDPKERLEVPKPFLLKFTWPEEK
jgi:parallel beta-helix repeat protein